MLVLNKFAVALIMFVSFAISAMAGQHNQVRGRNAPLVDEDLDRALKAKGDTTKGKSKGTMSKISKSKKGMKTSHHSPPRTYFESRLAFGESEVIYESGPIQVSVTCNNTVREQCHYDRDYERDDEDEGNGEDDDYDDDGNGRDREDEDYDTNRDEEEGEAVAEFPREEAQERPRDEEREEAQELPREEFEDLPRTTTTAPNRTSSVSSIEPPRRDLAYRCYDSEEPSLVVQVRVLWPEPLIVFGDIFYYRYMYHDGGREPNHTLPAHTPLEGNLLERYYEGSGNHIDRGAVWASTGDYFGWNGEQVIGLIETDASQLALAGEDINCIVAGHFDSISSEEH